jgi:hypothetical protein
MKREKSDIIPWGGALIAIPSLERVRYVVLQAEEERKE